MKGVALACLLVGGCDAAEPVQAKSPIPISAASSVSAAPTAAKAGTPATITGAERQLATELFYTLNDSCRGGVSPLDGNEEMRAKLTDFVCDWRKALVNAMLEKDLCFSPAKRSLAKCTSEERANFESVRDEWLMENQPHPSGAKLSKAYLRGDWSWGDFMAYPFDHFQNHRREACAGNKAPALNAGDTVDGIFVESKDNPMLLIPWTNDVAVGAVFGDEGPREAVPVVLVRCSAS